MRTGDTKRGRAGRGSLIFAVALAAHGCARTTVVGVSDEGTEPEAPQDGGESQVDAGPVPSASADPKRPSVIRGRPNEQLGYPHPVLGDVDGDGFDDFLVTSEMGLPLPDDVGSMAVYLFYGRREFPEFLSTDDADASFRASQGVQATGDVNGDGFDDWVLHHGQSIEFVWGGPNRRSGPQAVHASGTVWSSHTLPPPFAEGLSTYHNVVGAGDVNCDGVDDLIVMASRMQEEGESTVGSGFGLVMTSYLVLGREPLPEGVWDPAWAIARFEPLERVPNEWWEPTVIPARDLDGDGCDDLLSVVGDRAYVYYGGEDHPRGLVEPDSARATLVFQEGTDIVPIPDIDGDGASELVLGDFLRERLAVTYGSRDRLSGEVELPPEFEIVLEQPTLGGFSVDAGDINGDSWPELVVSLGSFLPAETPEIQNAAVTGALFAVRGTGERLRGQVRVSDGDVFVPAGSEVAPFAWESRELAAHHQAYVPSLSLAGDVDGDGGRDILAHVLVPTHPFGEIRLIPSTPRSPD